MSIPVNFTTQSLAASATGFVHPGILHKKADLDRMKANKGTHPWLEGYNSLNTDAYASATYTMKGPLATVDRGSTNTGNLEMWSDAIAAYRNALLWYTDGSTAHRDKALQILNAWANANTTITGKERASLWYLWISVRQCCRDHGL